MLSYCLTLRHSPIITSYPDVLVALRDLRMLMFSFSVLVNLQD